MKQGLIDAFLIKNANKLSLEQKIELKNQLQSCDDKAFALLTSHKKPTTRSNFWRRLLCVFSAMSAFFSMACFIGGICFWIDEGSLSDPSLFAASGLALLIFSITFLFIRKWHKLGKLKRMPKRKQRLYEDYLKIIQSYQETTQSIE